MNLPLHTVNSSAAVQYVRMVLLVMTLIMVMCVIVLQASPVSSPMLLYILTIYTYSVIFSFKEVYDLATRACCGPRWGDYSRWVTFVSHSTRPATWRPTLPRRSVKCIRLQPPRGLQSSTSISPIRQRRLDRVQRHRSCGRQRTTCSFRPGRLELSLRYGRPRLPAVSPSAPVLGRR